MYPKERKENNEYMYIHCVYVAVYVCTAPGILCGRVKWKIYVLNTRRFLPHIDITSPHTNQTFFVELQHTQHHIHNIKGDTNKCEIHCANSIQQTTTTTMPWKSFFNI